MSFSLKQHFTRNLLNIPGWRTNRRIVVIESDDWGSVRMPSIEVYEKFLKAGIRVDKDPYCRYDSLATKDDLEALFEVLSSVMDSTGRRAVLTANSVVANPDFDKIKAADFTQYFFEPFTTTLKRSSRHEGVFDLWKKGIADGVFHPQFHGREHLNVDKWLQVLREGEKATRLAFDFETFGLTEATVPTIKNNYMGAFNSATSDAIIYYDTILKEGLDLFEELFGYRSSSFIPTTYTWSPLIEPSLKKYGVDYLQGMVSQHIPLDDGNTFKYKNNNFQGKRNIFGQIYLTRNCFFEPTQCSNKIDVVDECLHRIKIAFNWGKAAVISSHRLNFIGSIDCENRNKNLILFKDLLNRIVKYWPDVEFMSSDQLGDVMKTQKLKN
ncbi:MAG TPA: hypothetical protein VFC67_18425 [Prolixibacteraceae bacterium]|nr:hypothetical protein [Prolixibacteraceae bacterium]